MAGERVRRGDGVWACVCGRERGERDTVDIWFVLGLQKNKKCRNSFLTHI